MEYGGYLFVHFTGEEEKGEQIYFALSRDGLHWKDLNGGQPVIESKIGEKGVRDPFIIRSAIDDRFYIIGTDLRIASGKGWEAAQHEGSTSLLVWSSPDLIHWSLPWVFEVTIPGAGCVWAPEAIYDEESKEYLVFWASMVREEGEEIPRQRIYCSRTRDFVDFTQPEKYLEKENHVIDTTIIFEDGVYYRFSKDETTKNIRADKSASLEKETFQDMRLPSVESLNGVEGPAVFRFNDRMEWCLLVDQYATGGGYLPLLTADLEKGEYRILNQGEYDMGINKKRHGSVLNLTEDEYRKILDFEEENKWNQE